MLRARLRDTIDSPGIAAVLPIAESKRLILAKTDGNIEVYSREHTKFKLFQVYPNILQNLHIDDPRIKDLLYSDRLSTIFIQCKNVILLLNSYNLHVYDRVVDKRGISKCWILSTEISKAAPDSDDDEEGTYFHNIYNEEEPAVDTERDLGSDATRENSTSTFLLYSTAKQSKLRLLIWFERVYKSMTEITLPSSSEYVTSANATPNGIILTTNNAVYVWSYTLSELVRIRKIVKRKYPTDMVSAIGDLRGQCHISDPNRVGKSGSSSYNVLERVSSSQGSNLTKKSGFSGFWGRKGVEDERGYKKIRYSFNDRQSSTLIVDGMTESLFEINFENRNAPFLISNPHEQFFEWNSTFETIEYLSTDILMLYNSNLVKFVDYKNVLGTYLIIWTNNDRILLYHYQVDDEGSGLDDNADNSSNDNNSKDEVSICGRLHDSDFYYLWRKVLFYQFFLSSPYSIELCASPNQEESLDICAMKLRDFTVLWCLRIFDSLGRCLKIISSNYTKSAEIMNKNKINISKFDRKYIETLEEIIIKGVYTYFIEVWAPPQLVILNTFPKGISELVNTLTNENHECINENTNLSTSGVFSITPDLFKKWIFPYLTDTRRHLKNLQKTGNSGIMWNYYGRSIKQKFEFFLLDNHGQLKIDDMLRLVDTVLFKVYIKYVPSMVGPLIRVDNSCDQEIVVTTLKSHKMAQELVNFYFQHGQHQEALGYLVNLSHTTTDESNQEKLKSIVKVLVISYLRSMDSQYIVEIFHYTSWLLESYGYTDTDRDQILEDVFFNNKNVDVGKNGMKIYKFISKFREILSLTYLELCVSDDETYNESLLFQLITRYLTEIKNGLVRKKMRSLFELPLDYNPTKMFSILDGFLENDRDNDDNVLTIDIRHFLQVLETFALFKDGKHKESIDILYSGLGDYQKSKRYCDRLYNSNKEEGLKISIYLLDKIIDCYELELKEDHIDTVKELPSCHQILTFISDQGTKIDSMLLLGKLPKSLPVSLMKKELTNIIIAKQLAKEELDLKKSLLQVEIVNSTFKVNEQLSKFVTLNETYKCSICKKSFSTLTSEETKWYNTDDKDYMVHYNCGKVLQSRLFPDQVKYGDNSKGPTTVKDIRRA
ncbi:Vacuolar morphogenesis protein 6 [Maudiozyma exigua]|uniref:Vacuolar morphogenesis protein 6 n=1 Tax=Maudiozyma exigua TaxID=34358 RepID=A0A9P7BAY6_MAUEX|nr:Vacuolar morphogenesis protein 6 [Kazachstania exigua]